MTTEVQTPDLTKEEVKSIAKARRRMLDVEPTLYDLYIAHPEDPLCVAPLMRCRDLLRAMALLEAAIRGEGEQ
jgi:hypothetical protein